MKTYSNRAPIAQSTVVHEDLSKDSLFAKPAQEEKAKVVDRNVDEKSEKPAAKK